MLWVVKTCLDLLDVLDLSGLLAMFILVVGGGDMLGFARYNNDVPT